MYEPEHCRPTNALLARFSETFDVCVPTPLAFLSTLLGVLSIVSWLFAQLPQVVKNYRLKSTSGLSVYFLLEWCGGDLSNLLGAILTGQAAWQVVVAGYYCFVDCMLIAQFTYYELLSRGRSGGATGGSKRHGREDGPSGAPGDMKQVVDGVPGESSSPARAPSLEGKETAAPAAAAPRDICIFRTPDYSTFSQSPHRAALRRTATSPFPSPSPKTILLTSLVLAVLTTTTTSATPLPRPSPSPSPAAAPFAPPAPPPALGTALSWLSTALYLLSRLPQLAKNWRRRSTAGLSPLLFAAAFSGNLFYSASLLADPRAWASCPAHGCRGWAGAAGSERGAWAAAAAPFFLGAAGVLVLDALVGVQFLAYADGCPDGGGGGGGGGKVGARGVEGTGEVRVQGWLRGWIPSRLGSFAERGAGGAGAGSRGADGAELLRDEEQPLLARDADADAA